MTFTKHLKVCFAIDVPLSKMSLIMTNGIPTVIGRKTRLLLHHNNKESCPKFFSYHCDVHLDAVCAKALPLNMFWTQ
jgi:hypothetical protein